MLSEERSETESTENFVDGRSILLPCGNLGCLIRLHIQLEQGRRPALSAGALVVDASVEADSVLFDLEKSYSNALEYKLSETLGTLEVALDAGVSGNSESQFEETNAGNLIADAFRAHHKGGHWYHERWWCIRANAPKGRFTLREALSLLPYGNHVCLVALKGELLLRVLEHGLARVAKRSGAFCQVSGLSYTYDPEGPVGGRIIEARLGMPRFGLNGIIEWLYPVSSSQVVMDSRCLRRPLYCMVLLPLRRMLWYWRITAGSWDAWIRGLRVELLFYRVLQIRGRPGIEASFWVGLLSAIQRR